MKIKFAARSEVGKVRNNNEDNLYCSGEYMSESDREKPFFLSGVVEAPCIFAVCDGMGGEDNGELASLTAVQTLHEYAEKIIESPLNIDDYISDVNDKLINIMREQNIRTGTTLVLALIREDSFALYNLGDSRGFRVSNGKLLRVTNDHTVAEEAVRMGLMKPEAEDDEDSIVKHMLMRFLGCNDLFGSVPDVSKKFNLDENTGGLLCSDGLTDMLKFPEIANIMTEAKTPTEKVNALVNTALEKGGHDNVTCIVFEIMR